MYRFSERLAASQVASYGMELVGYLFKPVTKKLGFVCQKGISQCEYCYSTHLTFLTKQKEKQWRIRLCIG